MRCLRNMREVPSVTVTAQTPSNSSTANGVTTVFPYTFKIIDDGDIEVRVDGVLQTLTTHYTVSGVGDNAGGNVTFLSAPANGAIVARRRNMAYIRETDYQFQGILPAAVLNPDLDAPVMMAQQLQEQVGRAARGPAGETWAELPAAAVTIAAMGMLEKYINNQRAPVAKGPGLGPAMRLRGRYLLVPPALSTVARQLFSPELTAGTPGVINVFRGQYQVILEPALGLGVTIGDTTTAGSDTAYYLIADGIDTVHWGYLRGENGPAISNMADFDTDGMKLKVTHNFGAAAVEWRGMAKSAGA